MKNDLEKDWQFVKFATVFCILGLALSTSIGVLWTNFSSITNSVENSQPIVTIPAVSDPQISFNALIGATSDFDINPRPWWIWNTSSVFELSNPSSELRIVTLTLSLGENPCGFAATGTLSIRSSTRALAPGKPILLTVKMTGNSRLLLPMTVNSLGCSIDTDARVFLASLTSTYSYRSVNEFEFKNT